MTGEDKLCVSETEDSEGVFPIRCTDPAFIWNCTDQRDRRADGCNGNRALVAELEKICKLNRVFLNEIV